MVSTAGLGCGAAVLGLAGAATHWETVFGWAGMDCICAESSPDEFSIPKTMTSVPIDANTMETAEAFVLSRPRAGTSLGGGGFGRCRHACAPLLGCRMSVLSNSKAPPPRASRDLGRRFAHRMRQRLQV